MNGASSERTGEASTSSERVADANAKRTAAVIGAAARDAALSRPTVSGLGIPAGGVHFEKAPTAVAGTKTTEFSSRQRAHLGAQSTAIAALGVTAATSQRESRGAANPAGGSRWSGCSEVRIARVGDGAVTIDLDDGRSVLVSSGGLMRVAAQQWSTGDSLVVCAATTRNGQTAVSMDAERHYDKVQATLVGTSATRAVSCSSKTLVSMEDDGQVLRTTDGATYTVSSNGLMRVEAARWSTGDEVAVCSARFEDGEVAAGLTNAKHYGALQASMTGRTAASTVSCATKSVVAVDSDGGTVEVSGHRIYRVSNAGLMRVEVTQWTTGETVRVCTTSSDGSASIENSAHYGKVQASRA